MLLTALSRKSHRCGTRTSGTIPAFCMPVSFTGQDIVPQRKWKWGIWSHPKYLSLGTWDTQDPSEASHEEPCLLGVNMTVLFLRVPWETNMPFQLGETPGPSSPHTEPDLGCWHMIPTTGQSSTSTTHPYPACLGGSRFIKPGEMCIPVVQNLV